jgi:hypothetical protein
LKGDHELGIIGYQYGWRNAHVRHRGHGTYLTVDWPRGIKCNHIEDYDEEGGYSGQRVNLTQGKRQSPAHEVIPKMSIATNPYCPTVGATPSDDIPLKVESGEEFPSET